MKSGLNKYILLIPSVLLIFGCSKKEKLTSTLQITVSPSSAAISKGSSMKFTASGTDVRGAVEINPVWSVSGSIGSVSPEKGTSVTFFATATGSGELIATDKGATGKATITVGEVFIVYDDTGFSTDLSSPQQYDGGDGSPDAAPWLITQQTITSDGADGDNSECQKYSYTNGSGYWGGVYVIFNTGATDMSVYTNLTFYVKGESGGEKFEIKIKDSTGTEGSIQIQSYITVSTSWKKATIPLSDFSGIDKTKITIPFNIAFTDLYTNADATVYIDLIKWE